MKFPFFKPILAAIAFPFALIISFPKIVAAWVNPEIRHLAITHTEGLDEALNQQYGLQSRYFSNFSTYSLSQIFCPILFIYAGDLSLFEAIGYNLLGTMGIVFIATFKEKGEKGFPTNRKNPTGMPVYECLIDQILFTYRRFFNINAKTVYGYTDLHMALSRKNYRRAQRLIKQGADITLKGDGKTILQLFPDKNHPLCKEVVKKLEKDQDYDCVEVPTDLIYDLEDLARNSSAHKNEQGSQLFARYKAAISKYSVREMMAEVHKTRAFKHWNEMVSDIDIQESSQKNYRALKARLRDQTELLTLNPEMQKHIVSKKSLQKSPQQVLTLEERKFFKEVMSGGWKLNHVTLDLDAIVRSGKILSSQQLKKKGLTARSHTAIIEGTTANGFFSIGPGTPETVRFLDQAKDVIEIDMDLLQDIPGALTGAWGSDHIYAYREKQATDPVKIFDHYQYQTKFIEVPNQNGGTKVVKSCIYTKPGYKSATLVNRGEEIFMHPQIESALVLMTLEKLRLLLSPKDWDRAMNETTLLEKQQLVQAFFHPGSFEFHKPIEFSIDGPMSAAVKMKKKVSNTEIIRFNLDLTIPENHTRGLIEALLKGKRVAEEALQKECKDSGEKININKLYPVFQKHQISFFCAAILSGDLTLVRACLDQGAEIHIQNKIHFGGKYFYNLSCIEAAIALSNPKRFQQLTSIELPELPALTSIAMLTLLLDYGQAYQKNRSIRRLCLSTPEMIESAIRLLGASEDTLLYLIDKTEMNKGDSTALCAAIRRGCSIQIIDSLHKKGADLNASCTPKDFSPYLAAPLLILVPNNYEGHTPLSISLIGVDKPKEIFEYLLKNKVDINRSTIKTTDSWLPTNTIAPLIQTVIQYLKLAGKFNSYKDQELIQSIEGIIRSLVRSGADVSVRFLGQSVFTLLSQLKREWHAKLKQSELQLGLESQTESQSEADLKSLILKIWEENTQFVMKSIDGLLDTFESALPSSVSSSASLPSLYETLPRQDLIFDQRAYVVLTGINEEGRRFVILNKQDSSNLSMHFPFFMESTSHFTIEAWMQKLYTMWEIDLRDKKTVSEKLGDFHYKLDWPMYLQKEGVLVEHGMSTTEFQFGFYVCDLGTHAQTLLNKLKNMIEYFTIFYLDAHLTVVADQFNYLTREFLKLFFDLKSNKMTHEKFTKQFYDDFTKCVTYQWGFMKQVERDDPNFNDFFIRDKLITLSTFFSVPMPSIQLSEGNLLNDILTYPTYEKLTPIELAFYRRSSKAAKRLLQLKCLTPSVPNFIENVLEMDVNILIMIIKMVFLDWVRNFSKIDVWISFIENNLLPILQKLENDFAKEYNRGLIVRGIGYQKIRQILETACGEMLDDPSTDMIPEILSLMYPPFADVGQWSHCFWEVLKGYLDRDCKLNAFCQKEPKADFALAKSLVDCLMLKKLRISDRKYYKESMELLNQFKDHLKQKNKPEFNELVERIPSCADYFLESYGYDEAILGLITQINHSHSVMKM